ADARERDQRSQRDRDPVHRHPAGGPLRSAQHRHRRLRADRDPTAKVSALMEAASISGADAQLKGPGLGGRLGRIVAQALRTWRGKVGLGLTLFVVAVALLGPLLGGTGPLELKGAPF